MTLTPTKKNPEARRKKTGFIEYSRQMEVVDFYTHLNESLSNILFFFSSLFSQVQYISEIEHHNLG